MPDATVPDYITKTEAAQVYRRSERSISRDITNALKFHEQRVLQHIELRLEDGSRKPGTKLSIEEVVDLRDKGQNPTWLLDTTWLRNKYGRRDEPRPAESDQRPDEPTAASAADQPLPDDLEQRAAVLAAQNNALREQNADLRTQAVRLEKELDRHAEARREENELQKQNNVLMQQVYNMLSSMQESAGQVTLLPAPRPESRTYGPETLEPVAVTTRKGTQPSTAKPSTNHARGSKSKKRGRGRQSQSAAPLESKPAPSTMRKYLPTIDRAVRSIFRR
jgi:hypothetical protein